MKKDPVGINSVESEQLQRAKLSHIWVHIKQIGLECVMLSKKQY